MSSENWGGGQLILGYTLSENMNLFTFHALLHRFFHIIYKRSNKQECKSQTYIQETLSVIWSGQIKWKLERLCYY